MASTPQQKARHAAIHRATVRLIRRHHPGVWQWAWTRATQQHDDQPHTQDQQP
jgi:hypothetical protein